MANWKEVTKEEFGEHLEKLEEQMERPAFSRHFRRDDIIVYYFGNGSVHDQQWVAKIHLDPKSYHIADLP